VILFALFALPLAALILRSFSSEFLSSALSAQALQALSLSLVTSSITTVVAVVLGTPLAYMLARSRSPGRAWLELILDLPIVLPPSVAGLALLIAFGRNGLFGPALSVFGISLPFTSAAVVLAQTWPPVVCARRIGFTWMWNSEPQCGRRQCLAVIPRVIPIAGRVPSGGS
jgi:molybdate transport system permease protein